MVFEDKFLEEMKETQRYLNRFFDKFEDLKIFNFNKEFNNYRRAFMDYKESANEFTISVELPGIEKKDIKLDTRGNSIIIKAEKRKEKEVGSKKKGDYKYSKSYSGFYQEASLPENADLEKMNAAYANGILKIVIPKNKLLTEEKKRKIEIK